MGVSRTSLEFVEGSNLTIDDTLNSNVLCPAPMEDHLLWNSFRGGDEQALVTIFDRNIKHLHNYGMKIANDRDLVKDAVQDLFIELWKNRSTLGETNSIKFYLYKSLRRKLIRIKIKESNRVLLTLPELYVSEMVSSREFEILAEQSLVEKKQYVEQLLNRLTKRQREAIFLRYFEEMEYEKIAVVMGLSKHVVYNLVHKAIDSLRPILSVLAGLLLFRHF